MPPPPRGHPNRAAWMAEQWDQRKGLQPPPYDNGPMAFRAREGLTVGDAMMDALPAKAVCCHGGTFNHSGAAQLPDPDWVDWDQVKRGQAVYTEHVGQIFFALSLALLQGFSIARFSEVLLANGYAQSPKTSYERYRETSFAFVDWMTSDLQDPESEGRRQIYNVRAMHSFARRNAKKKVAAFAEEGCGIPLSQYDMAEVQLAFTAVTFDMLDKDLGVHLTRAEKSDVTHACRLWGYHLGILDDFNVCNSLEESEAIFEEWMEWTPLRFETSRPCTYELQIAAVEGFGKYTGSGVEFWKAAVHYSLANRPELAHIDYLKVDKPARPLSGMFDAFRHRLASPAVQKASSREVLRMRHMFKTQSAARLKYVLSTMVFLGKLQDNLLVPMLSWYFHPPPELKVSLVALVAAVFVYVARRRRRLAVT